MKKYKLLMPILGLTSIATIAMPLSACGGDEDKHIVQPTTEEKTKTPDKGAVSATYTVTLKDSSSASDINVSIENETSNSIFKTPTWTVNDKICNITVEWADRPSKTQTATFTLVIKKTDASWTSEITDCKLTYTQPDVGEITVTTTKVGPYYASDEIQFTANVTPAEAPTAVTWSVDPIDAGEIDNTGKFIAKKVGKCTIKATSKTQTTKFGSKEITISSILKTETESNSKILKGFVDDVDFSQQVWKDRINKEFGSTLTIPADINKIAANAFCTSGVSTIPSSITALDLSKTTALTCILYQAFMSAPFGGKVIIPNTVEVLGNQAFARTNIAGIQFPQNDTIKANGVPSGFCESCTSLSSVTIPSNYEKIGSSAFYSTSALASITLPTSLKNIGEYAFYQSHITNVVIPNTVTSIDQMAFGNINSKSGGIGTVDLSAFTTPESINSLSVGSSAFSEIGTSQKASFIIANDSLHETWQNKLTDNAGVTWGPDHWNISVCVNDYFNIGTTTVGTTLKGFTTESTEEQIKAKTNNTLVIPNTVIAIDHHAFQPNYESHKIPSTITKLTFQKESQLVYLGQLAFSGSGIKDVHLPYTVNMRSGDYYNAFNDLSLDTIKIEAAPTGKTATHTTRNSSGTETNTIYNSDWTTLVRASNNTDLEALPSTLTKIDSNAFKGQDNLSKTTLTIPSTVTTIGTSIILNSNIASLVIPASVNTTDAWSFSNDSTTTIDMSAFAADSSTITLSGWSDTTFTKLPTSGTLYVNKDATTAQVTAWTTLLQSKGLPTSWTVQAKTSI